MWWRAFAGLPWCRPCAVYTGYVCAPRHRPRVLQHVGAHRGVHGLVMPLGDMCVCSSACTHRCMSRSIPYATLQRPCIVQAFCTGTLACIMVSWVRSTTACGLLHISTWGHALGLWSWVASCVHACPCLRTHIDSLQDMYEFMEAARNTVDVVVSWVCMSLGHAMHAWQPLHRHASWAIQLYECEARQQPSSALWCVCMTQFHLHGSMGPRQ